MPFTQMVHVAGLLARPLTQTNQPVMPDNMPPDSNLAAPNLPEFSVTELSQALKRTVEDTFPYVRVRGELGRVSRPRSGHVYLDMKDDKSVLGSVIWKGTVSKLAVQPEEGLEVIATGRLTTYPGQSKYQLVIERLEVAGVGALMALLEKRKRALAAEGLFDADRKKAIPYIPEVVGVVTSPSGAVIRDILHRLADRFPRHVLLWPVAVQGDAAKDQIAAAIDGFNRLERGGAVPRPDVLIVARGGGSIEDLWAFNEEVVVRAAAASSIPLISAVGHETDTTLIDFASDLRAPTPTGAAEMAVPVRAELMADVLGLERRLVTGMTRGGDVRRQALAALARALPRADTLLEGAAQRLDYATGRLAGALRLGLRDQAARFREQGGRLSARLLRKNIEGAGDQVASLGRRLGAARARLLEDQRVSLTRQRDVLGQTGQRLTRAMTQNLVARQTQLASAGKLLRSYSYHETLQRGFALVRDDAGKVVRSAATLSPGAGIGVSFADGDVAARVEGGASRPKPAAKPKKPAAKQSSLFDDGDNG